MKGAHRAAKIAKLQKKNGDDLWIRQEMAKNQFEFGLLVGQWFIDFFIGIHIYFSHGWGLLKARKILKFLLDRTNYWKMKSKNLQSILYDMRTKRMNSICFI